MNLTTVFFQDDFCRPKCNIRDSHDCMIVGFTRHMCTCRKTVAFSNAQYPGLLRTHNDEHERQWIYASSTRRNIVGVPHYSVDSCFLLSRWESSCHCLALYMADKAEVPSSLTPHHQSRFLRSPLLYPSLAERSDVS